MPYDLKISMTGLGIFIVDDSSNVHFLMPTSGTTSDGGGGGQVGHDHGAHNAYPPGPAVHAACLLYDAAHLGTGGPGSGFVSHDLSNRIFDLTKIGTGPVGTGDRLNPAILDLDPLLNSRVKPDVLTEPYPGKDLTARVSLYSGGVTCCAGRALWVTQASVTDKPQLQQMAYLIEWTIPGLADSPLSLSLRRLDNAREVKLPPLLPVDEGGVQVIRLWVIHVPPSEMPPFGQKPSPLPTGATPPHLPMAFRLFSTPGNPLIHFAGLGDPPTPTCSKTSPPRAGSAARSVSPMSAALFLGDEFTCAPGRGSIG